MSNSEFGDQIRMQQTLVPEECSDCPITKCLSGEALELLIESCTGLVKKEMGCEEVYVCGSTRKHSA